MVEQKGFTLVLFLALCLGTDSVREQSSSSFPLQVSGNARYLVDANRKPFMIHGDSAWSILVQLTGADAEYYLEDRRQKGFNTIILNVLEHHFANNAPKNVDGDGPFTTPGDFSTPNPAYFAHLDFVLTKAAEKGILVFAEQAYRGDHTSVGWSAEIVNNGPTKCRNYGRYLGNRYKNFTNIIWTAWGDHAPEPGTALETNSIEILKGIEDNAPAHLHTAHIKRDITAREVAAFKPYMDLDALYSSVMPYVESLRRYGVSDPKPTFVLEAFYEGYQGSGQPLGTPSLVRRQAYWTMTSGATGHIYGNHGLWGFGWTGWKIPDNTPTWKEDLGDPGTLDMAHVKSLFSGRPWYNLVPDGSATVVTGGRGTKATADPKTDVTNPSGYDYVTAARTADGTLVMAYLPPTGTAARTITVNMSKLGGTATAQWFNPNTGEYTTISGSPFANSGVRNFTTPGNNGDDTNDWVLVLETAPKS